MSLFFSLKHETRSWKIIASANLTDEGKYQEHWIIIALNWDSSHLTNLNNECEKSNENWYHHLIINQLKEWKMKSSLAAGGNEKQPF